MREDTREERERKYEKGKMDSLPRFLAFSSLPSPLSSLRSRLLSSAVAQGGALLPGPPLAPGGAQPPAPPPPLAPGPALPPREEGEESGERGDEREESEEI